jgi:hypothetical protein
VTGARPDTRLELQTVLSGIGALLLLASLFVDWYGAYNDFSGGDDRINAWQAFELLDALLAALALLVLYEIARTVAVARSWPPATSLARLAGPLALALIVVSMLSDPPITIAIGVNLKLGIWLAFAGAVLMTVGTVLRRVRVSFVVAPRDARPAPPPSPPPADPDAETRTFPRD